MSSLSMPSVLIVDDDKNTRQVLKHILKKSHFTEVAEASSGKEAIMRCQLFKPNIVLLDINMPQMNGIETLEEIRTVYPKATVLMTSADLNLDKVKEALSKGASGFVVKPFKPVILVEKIIDTWKKKK